MRLKSSGMSSPKDTASHHGPDRFFGSCGRSRHRQQVGERVGELSAPSSLSAVPASSKSLIKAHKRIREKKLRDVVWRQGAEREWDRGLVTGNRGQGTGTGTQQLKTGHWELEQETGTGSWRRREAASPFRDDVRV